EGRLGRGVKADGRGVDAEGIARAAAERGLVAPGTRLTDEQALRLIFRPGFSTSSRATLVSGRGVGLDVVERAVEEAGGEVRVRSERGRGTVFEMRLPTTLALLPAFVVVRARAGRDDEEDETKRCAAVVVDGWEGQTEVLVRGLGRHAKRWRGVVGATELSGGEVALVIDLPRLLEALV